LSAGKAEVVTRRNEKLAKRNPERIRKQLEDLKAITSGGGTLTRHEEQVLEGLEKELKAVTKARESLGDKAPTFGRGPPRDGARDGGVLGKRRRDAEDASSSDSDVPEEVRNIPMPRDTPPPIPKDILDKWYAKRRARRNANLEPLGEREGQPPKPKLEVEAKTVYESKPVVRDLRKEAVSTFVPAAVRMKMDRGSGKSGLLDPEEADLLEKEGYLKAAGREDGPSSNDMSPEQGAGSRMATVEEVEDGEG